MPLISRVGRVAAARHMGQWLAHLRALTALAIRDSAPVIAALAELELMGPMGPVTLDEVRMVLAERLGRLEAPPSRRRYGEVYRCAGRTTFAAWISTSRSCPGLVERVFPKKLAEDPILPDAARRRALGTCQLQANRVARERLALRLAAGAARRRMLFPIRASISIRAVHACRLSMRLRCCVPPRDVCPVSTSSRGAPRATVLRVWDGLRRARRGCDRRRRIRSGSTRQLVEAGPGETVGAAHYLLAANPHLGRALRARARRWLRRWTPNDGLVDPGRGDAPRSHGIALTRDPIRPPRLQNFAACPYRFLLYGDPSTRAARGDRGDRSDRSAHPRRAVPRSAVRIADRLRAAGRLPVTRATLVEALAGDGPDAGGSRRAIA